MCIPPNTQKGHDRPLLTAATTLICLNPCQCQHDHILNWLLHRVHFTSAFSKQTHSCSECCSTCCVSLQLWQFLTEGPVFSSPSFAAEQRFLCGSHDGRVYCLNCADGSLVWTFHTTGKVYSTPCVFDGSAAGERRSLVGVASTDGTVWILDALDGQAVASYTLPGELFSSPLVWKQFLIIGCRDDYLYCLNLNVKE